MLHVCSLAALPDTVLATGEAMHGFNEYVDLESLRQSTKATALFIAEWCGVEKA